MTTLIIKQIALMSMLIYASIKDMKTRKISKYIFYIGILSALIFDLFIFPISIKNVIIKSIWMVIIFLFGALRLLGIGDIKIWMIITAYMGIITSSIIVVISCILLIVVNVIKDSSNLKLVFLTFSQLANKQKIVIVEQKAYAFIPYMTFSTLLVSVVMIFL